MNSSQRRYDVDWVRIIATVAVFTFHNLMYFNTWSWHAKNSSTTASVLPVNLALLDWIMPVFFLLSGFGARQALMRRTPSQYLKERLLRLVVPLLTAIFLLSPFQVYSERITYGQFRGSFLAFLPHYFEGWYSSSSSGNFAWHGLHLWYVVVLIICTLVTLPFFARLIARPKRSALGGLIDAAGPAGAVLIPPFLILTLEGLLFALGLDASQSGWPFGAYLAYYIMGFAILPGANFALAVQKYWRLALLVVIPATLLTAMVPEPEQFGPALIGFQLVKVYACWLTIICLFGLTEGRLNRNSPAVQYCSEAVMPFYVLHQPVIVALGFAIRRVPLAMPLKFPLLFGASLAIIVGVYHFIVRPFSPLRVLLGMKPLPSRSVAQTITQ